MEYWDVGIVCEPADVARCAAHREASQLGSSGITHEERVPSVFVPRVPVLLRGTIV